MTKNNNIAFLERKNFSMKTGLLIFLVLVGLASCGPHQKKDNSAFRIKEYHYRQPDSLSKYFTAEVDYFLIDDDSDLANEINNKVLYVYTGQAEGIPDDPNILLENYFAGQLKEIRDLVAEFGGTELLPYQYNYTATVENNNDKLFSFKQDFFTYTGGAHGMYGTIYNNYDRKMGKEIMLTTLFSGNQLKKLNKMGERLFREQQEIPQGQSFEDAGYFFDDGFVLSGNFLIAKDTMLFYYAPYEIGPYSLGSIILKIPNPEIRKEMPEARLFQYVK